MKSLFCLVVGVTVINAQAQMVRVPEFKAPEKVGSVKPVPRIERASESAIARESKIITKAPVSTGPKADAAAKMTTTETQAVKMSDGTSTSGSGVQANYTVKSVAKDIASKLVKSEAKPHFMTYATTSGKIEQLVYDRTGQMIPVIDPKSCPITSTYSAAAMSNLAKIQTKRYEDLRVARFTTTSEAINLMNRSLETSVVSILGYSAESAPKIAEQLRTECKI